MYRDRKWQSGHQRGSLSGQERDGPPTPEVTRGFRQARPQVGRGVAGTEPVPGTEIFNGYPEASFLTFYRYFLTGQVF
jgi:hypothetical protein